MVGIVVSLLVALILLDHLFVTSLRIARAQAGDTSLGAIFPHPRLIIPLALALLLQTLAAGFFLQPQLGAAGIIYPVSLTTAGLLIVLLTTLSRSS
jgi:hypothetical protein